MEPTQKNPQRITLPQRPQTAKHHSSSETTGERPSHLTALAVMANCEYDAPSGTPRSGATGTWRESGREVFLRAANGTPRGRQAQ